MAKGKSSDTSSAMRTFATFAGGVVLGIAVAPYVKKALKDYAPSLDKTADAVAKKAGQAYERATDVMAEAKEKLKSES